jgi:2-oxoglutarate ferredoxin oxidoreductase subunit delta
MVRKPITPKPPRTREKVLVILREQCKECMLCIEFCPKNVLCLTDIYNRKGYHPVTACDIDAKNVLCLTDIYNRKGYHPVTACDIDACVNCEFCERICPDMAIFLADRNEAEKAYEAGALEEGTDIPEFERDSPKKEEK